MNIYHAVPSRARARWILANIVADTRRLSARLVERTYMLQGPMTVTNPIKNSLLFANDGNANFMLFAYYRIAGCKFRNLSAGVVI